MEILNEQELIEQYLNGDIEALEQLVEQYRKPLFGFIVKMMESSSEAEDVFQEVWFRALKNMRTYKHKKFLSWLFRIAHNLIIDRVRKKKPDFSLQDKPDEDVSLEEKIGAPGLGPDEIVGGRDIGIKIQNAVNRLPVKQKEIFLMRSEGELSFKEIAKIQKISINTALARMQYALQKLREELEDDYNALLRTPS